MSKKSNSRFVDENKDLLDDRIVSPDSHREENETASTIADRISHIRLTELPEALLRKMLLDIEEEQDTLSNKMAEAEKTLHKELIQGNGSFLDDTKLEAKLIERAFTNLTEHHDNIYHALQEKIVSNGMKKLLGSQKLVNVVDGFIFLLIIAVLSAMTYEFTQLNPDLDQALILKLFYFDTIACFIFMAEFKARYDQAEDKRWFWKNHWIDFVTSIPIPPLALFENASFIRYGRTLRLLRILRILRVGRLVRIFFFFWRGMDKLAEVLDVKLMKKSLKGLIIAIVLGAILILYVEGDDPSVSSIGQSIWWSFTTVVTSGFGDIYNPQGTAARILTVVLIIMGMVAVGVFTATLTSLYVEEGTEELQIMQKTLDERFTNLSKSHKQGSEERQQGVKERKALDDHLREGLEKIYSNQKEISDRLDNLEKKPKD